MIQASPLLHPRQELAAFLRARRDATDASGLVPDDGTRRHVPGLRREEVAALAGISTTWYTWIEQGREINMSADVIEKVGNALRLAPHEIAYVRRLASDAPPEAIELAPAVPDALRVLVEEHEAAPAYIATPRFDLLVMNDFMKRVFNYGDEHAGLQRNIMWRMFFDDSRRSLYMDWETVARGTVASFRYNFASYRGEPHFEALLTEMLKNADFRRMWDLFEVAAPGLPPFMIRDASLGLCELTTIQASLGISPGCYLVLFAAKQLS